jgi:hypothetical protein
MSRPFRLRRRTFAPLLPSFLLLATAALGCNETAAPATGATTDAADEAPRGEPIDMPDFSTEWAHSVALPGDWVTCGTTGAPISDAQVLLRGGRLEFSGDATNPTLTTTAIVSVSGSIDLNNLPSQGNLQCAIDLTRGLKLVTFPPPPLRAIPIPNTPLNLRLTAQPIGVIELGIEDMANGTGSIPFEISAELGLVAFAAQGGRFVPYSRIISSKFSPVETSISGAFKGYIEGNFGVGLTALFNEVVGVSANLYYEPNFAWELPLSGCDMTYGLTARWVLEGCLGAQTPEGLPIPAFEVGYCGQFKGDNQELLKGDVSIFRTEPDQGLKVAPGETVTLPLLANDACLGGGVLSRLEHCAPLNCAIDPGGQTVTYRAIEVDGLARQPGTDVATYCVRSPLDQKERCNDFSVITACPAATKWVPAARACQACDSPAECACQEPRTWDGSACLCPPDAPLYDAASNLCTPCAVAGSTYNAAANQCECNAPRQSDGFRCDCPREAPHFLPDTNECVACPPNMVDNGISCVCVEPAVLDASGQCVPPCAPPTSWDGYECRCPAGVPFESCFPSPTCPSPSFFDNGVCVCPFGATCACPEGRTCSNECRSNVDLCERIQCPGGVLEPWGSDNFDGSCQCICPN